MLIIENLENVESHKDRVRTYSKSKYLEIINNIMAYYFPGYFFYISTFLPETHQIYIWLSDN